MTRFLKRRFAAAACVAVAVTAAAACSSGGSSGGNASSGSSSTGTVTVAVVSNPLITGQMIPLTQSVFEKQNPGITVKFATYTEGDLRAAISIGVNPHYGGTRRRIEAFLLDWSGDLYGRRLVVEVWRKLRDERAFESEQALVDQIARDVEQTRAAVRPGA